MVNIVIINKKRTKMKTVLLLFILSCTIFPQKDTISKKIILNDNSQIVNLKDDNNSNHLLDTTKSINHIIVDN